MKSVGVKQLKTRLSEYLRLVRNGETVLVTDRDEVVAELRPTRRQPGTGNSLEGLLDALAERGEVTRAGLLKRRSNSCEIAMPAPSAASAASAIATPIPGEGSPLSGVE